MSSNEQACVFVHIHLQKVRFYSEVASVSGADMKAT